METIEIAEEFNEADRFKPYYINLSEMIYGENFQSPGGNEFLNWVMHFAKVGADCSEALDVGFGCGGNSIFLHKKFNCPVTAIDMNDTFLWIASERVKEAGINAITLINSSVLDFRESDRFDIILCRDVLMYVKDKERALRNIMDSMKIGGRLILVDYCKRDGDISPEFAEHIGKGGFSLATLDDYRRLMENLGFDNIMIADITSRHIHYLSEALLRIKDNDNITDTFRSKDIDYIKKRTVNKIGYCSEGSMVWGLIVADLKKKEE